MKVVGLHTLILFVILCLNTLNTTAQYRGEMYYKGKIQLNDKTKYKLGNVEFGDSALTAINLISGDEMKVAYSNLNKVKVMGDNRMLWEGVAIGLLTAAATTTLIVVNQGNPLDINHYVSGFARTAPFLGILGGLVGFTIKRYDTVPMDTLLPPPNELGASSYSLGVSYLF